MRRSFRNVTMAAMLVASGVATCLHAGGQAAGGQSGAASTAAPAQQVAVGSGTNAAAPQTAAPDTRTEKQKALARQTERLFDMATELKVQVDKTNKNILSLTVVEKAEEIEYMAKGMKDQAKR